MTNQSILDILAEQQILRYHPLMEQYPGRWALRRDLVWVPHDCGIPLKPKKKESIFPLPYVFSFDTTKSGNWKDFIYLGLRLFQKDYIDDLDEFYTKAINWIASQNSVRIVFE